MAYDLLASAIGTICSRHQGLYKLVLPRSLPDGFKEQVCRAIKEAGGVPVSVGDGEGELSAGEAIAFRTPEGGSLDQAIVLIATDGEVRELKSLETFRDLLAGGMPGGLNTLVPAILTLDDVAAEVARLAARRARTPLEVHRLEQALKWALAFLAEAYREAGNDEKRWTDAYWKHSHMLVRHLASAICTLPSGTPSFERDAVFASAGLPRPDGVEYYAVKNSYKKYARIISKSWSSQQEIERALVEIDRVDTGGAGNHPLFSVGWLEFASTRTVLGHQLLAVAYHCDGADDFHRWLDGWASTSEKAFFQEKDPTAPQYELYALSEGGDSEFLSPLGWHDLDHVLPPGPTALREDGRISLGKFRLHLAVDIGASEQPDLVTLASQPSSSCTPEILSRVAGDGSLVIDFELSRRAGKNGGKWREKPFTLSALPSQIVPGSSFLNGLSLKLCAPHPARPTAIAVDDRGGRRKPVPAFATDGRYETEHEQGAIGFGNSDQAAALLKLRDGMEHAKLAVIGPHQDARWVGGESLTPANPETADAAFQYYALTPLPEDAVIALGGYQVNVQAPAVDRGEVNPIVASILGEPVVPADDDLRRELLSDPRGLLEEWFERNCISEPPTEHVRSCLGISVLEAASRGTGRLDWNADIGTFADTSAPLTLAFPQELAKTTEAEAFWEAFENLELKAYGGAQQISAWPSALDLRSMPRRRVDRYVSTYSDLLKTVGQPRVHAWLAYPFSALLYDQSLGHVKGVLLSPLHPLKLAWAWSVQRVSDEVAHSAVFGSVASSFLRFVDSELLPLSGPAPRGAERWVSTGLAPGPRELFAGWTLLAGAPLRESRAGKVFPLMGLELPFGTPSGLDKAGVAAALRDYMRVYPASPQIRIGLAAPRGGQRYAEADEAIVAASRELIALFGDRLPGGVRIVDEGERGGHPPSPVNVLRKVLPRGIDSEDPAASPPFEWTTETEQGDASTVDIQFIEDTVVHVAIEDVIAESEIIGTSGPALPFSRYRSWHLGELPSGVSSYTLGLQDGCFGELPSFASALKQVENLKAFGEGLRLTAELSLGSGLLGDRAHWTITGNRHLDPAVLSYQLHDVGKGLALWEWRPAFLSRKQQTGATVSVASTHPYTVLARPSRALTKDIASVLHRCCMASSDEDAHDVIANLGVRGVGLSSLLTMGHTQSLGAIGFSLAFEALESWESSAGSDEVRCMVPMDAVYPLLDVLGQGAGVTDDQRRADLLLMSARLPTDGPCSLRFHAIEIKMRSVGPGSFPGRGSASLDDALEQLASTHRVLARLCQNYEREGRKLPLARAALATLLEAALSLRPASAPRQAPFEAKLLGAVASGDITLSTSRGTLFWFQVDATGAGGGPYEKRSPGDGEPGKVFANPAALDDPATTDEIRSVVESVIEEGRPAATLAGVTRPMRGKRDREKPSGRGISQPTPHDGPKPSAVGSDLGAEPSVEGGEPTERSRPREDTAQPGETLTPEGVSILVGSEPAGASMRPVYFQPSETALNQLNIGVVGDLGTGKTQFLQSLVYQLSGSAAGNRGHAPKVFVFDYKRDYSEGRFAEALGAKILDPSNQPLPINFFALGVDPDHQRAVKREQVRRASFFCDLLRRISRIGQVQRNDLYSSVLQAYDACALGHAPSINDIFDVYSSLGKNDSVVSVLTLMRDLVIFEPDPQNTATFGELFDRSTVLDLSTLGGAGQDIVDIVATMFLDNLYTDYMKKLPKEGVVNGADGIIRRKIDSFVLIDEAHHAMGRGFSVLMKLMLEGREFGMGVVLSSQFLSHFESGGHDWGEALSTWVIHNVRNATSKHFERIGFRRNLPRMVQDVAGLETHWAYYRCVNGYNEGILMKGQPFYDLP